MVWNMAHICSSDKKRWTTHPIFFNYTLLSTHFLVNWVQSGQENELPITERLHLVIIRRLPLKSNKEGCITSTFRKHEEAAWRIYALVKHTNIALDNDLSPIQCCHIVNRTIKKIFQWTFVQYSNYFIQENAHENVICEWRPLCLGFFNMLIMKTSSYGHIFRVTGLLCGNSSVVGESPTQRPMTRSFDVFFDLRLNKRISKQFWGWLFETPSRSLWRHWNA